MEIKVEISMSGMSVAGLKSGGGGLELENRHHFSCNLGQRLSFPNIVDLLEF